MFLDKDLTQIQEHDLTKEQVLAQIQHFKLGFDAIVLDRPATINDGILHYSSSQIDAYAKLFDSLSRKKKLLKFVPASGAATRMFKMVYELESFIKQHPDASDEAIRKAGFVKPLELLYKLPEMACNLILDACIQADGSSLKNLLEEKKYLDIIEYLMTPRGLGYSHLPKGLIMFHAYDEHNRLALEEQLIEGIAYACVDGVCPIHFTVSPEHLDEFQQKVDELTPIYEKKYGIRFEISFSCQKQATDTVAVDLNNLPFRTMEDQLLFRPAGHGALIGNLGEQEADLIFVKNIDNVQQEEFLPETVRYKKALGAVLLSLQQRLFTYLEDLEEGNLDDEHLEQIADFCENELCIDVTPGFSAFESMEKLDYLFTLMHRPIRVCGMVKNEGEAGGGPFWVEQLDGSRSLQIVEQAQVDKKDKEQKTIAESATHFNPVDLICSFKDFQGEFFDLEEFIDPQTAFITEKSFEGQNIKALEKPGLWNGAMADWITLFVEVPASTFNPVKCINDLLRLEH